MNDKAIPQSFHGASARGSEEGKNPVSQMIRQLDDMCTGRGTHIAVYLAFQRAADEFLM